MFRKPLALIGLSLLFAAPLAAQDWPRFRGPNGTGVSSDAKAPVEWSADKNLTWSVDLPGPGGSSPIVVGDKILLTCYTGYGVNRENPGDVNDLVRHLIAFDRDTGKELWRSSVPSAHEEDPYQGFIQEHGYASSTPVTDGEHAFVLLHKTGVAAFDLDGNQKWLTNVGTKSDPAKWGGGASCILHGDLVIVNAGIVGNAIVALNKADGTEAWRVEDAGFTNSWSTPVVVNVNGRDELVFLMPGKVLALNPANGEQLWFAKSPIAQTVTGSLAVDGDMVYGMGGRQGSALAVQCGGSGDVSDTHVKWNSSLRSGIATPLAANGHLFWSSGGIAFCASCETGEYVYRERLKAEQADGQPRRGPAGDYASPVLVGDNIVMLTRNGTTYVVKASDQFEIVATNSFADDDSLHNGTPAVSGGQIFIRSDKRLYCIGQRQDRARP